jgi:hypothetical protein
MSLGSTHPLDRNENFGEGGGGGVKGGQCDCLKILGASASCQKQFGVPKMNLAIDVSASRQFLNDAALSATHLELQSQ